MHHRRRRGELREQPEPVHGDLQDELRARGGAGAASSACAGREGGGARSAIDSVHERGRCGQGAKVALVHGRQQQQQWRRAAFDAQVADGQLLQADE